MKISTPLFFFYILNIGFITYPIKNFLLFSQKKTGF